MFDIDELVASCREALKERNPELAVKEIMERTMSNPAQVESVLGTPTLGGIVTLHRSRDLTVLKVIWAPGMSIYPHDHRMWAVIGIYGGREDNTFYRRGEEGLTQVGFKELETKDAVVLGGEVIHAVTNPKQGFTGAIHIYGGDFFNEPRSEWDPVTFEERPYDIENVMRQYEMANELFGKGTSESH